MLKKRRRYGRLQVLTVLAIAYAILLFVVTHVPNEALPQVVKASDKVMHFGAYGLLAWLIAWAVSQKSDLRWPGYLFVWGAVALYGVFDELLQLIPAIHRTADIMDWFADITGVTCALIAFAMYAGVRKAMQLRSRQQ